MKKSLLFAVAALVTSVVPGNAALNILDSASFANQYSGTDLFDGTTAINGWEAAGGATDANLALNGSNLVMTLSDTNGWLQHDNGATPWETGSGSWTVEARALVGSSAGAGGFVIWGALNGERDIMTVREGSVTTLGGTVFDSNSNIDTFHTFRLAYDATGDAYHYFRDGVQLTPDEGIGQQAGTANTRLIIGDCCTSVDGSTLGGPGSSIEIEYIRYDNTGAFSPVPEPSVAGLLALGLAGVFVRRRR
ncbi:MAG: PEP-CTERM sorting domain-containing protein [Verrucomicrobiales bacterium]